MRRERAAPRSERGQTLVIVAMALVGLLALAGLAIDGGNLVVQRRRAQNAADAAALAGTRLIALAMQTCEPIDMPALDATIHQVVNRYAEQNGISDTNGVAGDEVNENVVAYYVDGDETRLGRVGEVGALPADTAGVAVALQDEDRTYFLLLVGIDILPSSAQATAMTGVVRQYPRDGELIPVAIPLVVVQELSYGTEWEMHDTSDGEFCLNGGSPCIEDPGAPHNAQRGWLNLNHIFNNDHLGAGDGRNRTFQRNLSNADCIDPLPGLKGYASGDCPYGHPVYAGDDGQQNGDFIHGISGARQAALSAVYDGYAGEIAYAPVFDRVYLHEEMVETFDPQAESPSGWPNGGGFSRGGGGTNSYYYHVVGYVAARIRGTPAQHILHATFQEAVIKAGLLDVYGYDGTCTVLLHGVTLWR